jgi:hypothetical protein
MRSFGFLVTLAAFTSVLAAPLPDSSGIGPTYAPLHAPGDGGANEDGSTVVESIGARALLPTPVASGEADVHDGAYHVSCAVYSLRCFTDICLFSTTPNLVLMVESSHSYRPSTTASV